MVLESWQLYLIGLVASLLAQGVKLLIAKTGTKPNAVVMTGIAFVVSLVLAFFFAKPSFPSTSSPDFVPQLINMLTALVGAAMVIYNVLLKKLLELVGMTAERFLPKG